MSISDGSGIAIDQNVEGMKKVPTNDAIVLVGNNLYKILVSLSKCMDFCLELSTDSLDDGTIIVSEWLGAAHQWKVGKELLVDVFSDGGGVRPSIHFHQDVVVLGPVAHPKECLDLRLLSRGHELKLGVLGKSVI